MSPVFTVRKEKIKRRKRALLITKKYRVVTSDVALEFVSVTKACDIFNRLEADALYVVTMYGYQPIKETRLL